MVRALAVVAVVMLAGACGDSFTASQHGTGGSGGTSGSPGGGASGTGSGAGASGAGGAGNASGTGASTGATAGSGAGGVATGGVATGGAPFGGAPAGGAGAGGNVAGGTASGGVGASGGLGAAGGTGGSTGGTGGSTANACDKQYGSVQFYKLCKDPPGECHFIAANKVQSCGIVCKTYGGECLGAYDNIDGNPTCGQSTVVDCNYVGWYEIVCVCSKGCGGSPPCTYPKTCVSGACA